MSARSGSDPTLRTVLRGGPLPAGRAVEVVGELARTLAARHRAGAPHGAVGPDTVVLAGGRVRLLDPAPGARGGPDEGADTGADAYERDTRALGTLLLAAAGGAAALPPAIRELAARTASGAVVTPAAFAAQLAEFRVAPPPATAPPATAPPATAPPATAQQAAAPAGSPGRGLPRARQAAPPGATPPVPPPTVERAGSGRPGEGRHWPHRQYTDASLDDLFGAPISERSGGGALPPELDPRRPVSKRWLRGREADRRAADASPHRGLATVLTVAVLLAALVAAVLLITGGRSDDPDRAADRTTPPGGTSASTPATSTGSGGTRPPATGGGTPGTGTPLRPAVVSAFDPDGDGQEGVDPPTAATDGDRSTAWTTDRYTTPDLSGLKPGVGLLLDLGRDAAVRQVAAAFGVAGTSLEVYVGTAPGTLRQSAPAAAADDAGPGATLSTRPGTHGRYVLLWLTRLPPAEGGGYRGSIREVKVTG